jgi:SAM-dependent methyltransferase
MVPAPPDKPERPGADGHQAMVQGIARDPSGWTDELRSVVVGAFEAMAPTWDDERGGYRAVPLLDALARGGPFADGPCAEVACGTGTLTPVIRRQWPAVVGFDVTPGMLARGRGPRALADAAHLPLGDCSVVAMVLADAPLFAAELDRVLAPGGVVVWSNALGRDAPYHVPTTQLLDALAGASHRPWDAVGADAGWGTWAVLRRR